MILQGVKPTIQPLEIGDANRPKKVCVCVCVCVWRFPIYAGLPSFDLTTSAR